MKKILIYCAASLAMVSFTGCSDDINYNVDGDGEGRLVLRASLKGDVEVKSRATTDDELASTAIIWISNTKGNVVRKYNGIDEIPVAGIPLTSDTYVIEGWAGDSVSASFDARYFKGVETIALTKGSTKQVNLVCKIANVVSSLNFDEGVTDLLSDISFEIGHRRGTLTFTQEDAERGRKGYFMMPSNDKNLSWTLRGTKIDGKEYVQTGVIEEAKPATEYVITIKCGTSSGEEIGGAIFEVVVDPTEILVENNFEISAPPSISGASFDLAQPMIAEAGSVGRQSLWITATAPLKSVSFDVPAELGLESVIGGNDFELFAMSADNRQKLEDAGLNYVYNESPASEGNGTFSSMKINFEERLLNSLPTGDHRINLVVTDENGRYSSASFNILLTNAVVKGEKPSEIDIWPTKATLAARVLADDATGLGFRYRVAGTMQWTEVLAGADGTAKNEIYYATVEDLTPGATYEYQAIATDFVASETITFTTEPATQLKNAGFEQWNTSGKAYLLCTDENDMFWDSGNHGSATMNKNVTVPDGSLKHSGEYSAKLQSQFVGLGGLVGKFAAGNVFVGEYLDTQGTDGVLGWGREFTSRPKSLKGYVRYAPATIEYVSDGAPAEYVKGDSDKGIIYIALVTNEKDSYNGKSWPCVVKTKSSDRHLFDSSAENSRIIGYGELVFDRAWGSDSEMVEFEIPIEYRRTDVKVSNIIVVGSASKGGDYFCGGASVMNLDDLQLVY